MTHNPTHGASGGALVPPPVEPDEDTAAESQAIGYVVTSIIGWLSVFIVLAIF
jgi:hypothetical protein